MNAGWVLPCGHLVKRDDWKVVARWVVAAGGNECLVCNPGVWVESVVDRFSGNLQRQAWKEQAK